MLGDEVTTLTQMIRSDHAGEQQQGHELNADEISSEEYGANLLGVDHATARWRAVRLGKHIDELSSQYRRQDRWPHPHAWL
jgi:hypothetical protein